MNNYLCKAIDDASRSNSKVRIKELARMKREAMRVQEELIEYGEQAKRDIRKRKPMEPLTEEDFE